MSQMQVQEEPQDGRSAAERAVELDRRYKALKAELEDVKTERALALEEAVAAGWDGLDGYRFVRSKPPMTVTEDSIVQYDLDHGTDHLGGFISWWRRSCPVRISASAFGAYLASLGLGAEADRAVLDEVTVPSEAERAEYSIRAPKEGSR